MSIRRRPWEIRYGFADGYILNREKTTTLLNNTTYNTNRILVLTTKMFYTLKKILENWISIFFQCVKYWIKYNNIKIINHKPELKTTFCWSSIKTKNFNSSQTGWLIYQNSPRDDVQYRHLSLLWVTLTKIF